MAERIIDWWQRCQGDEVSGKKFTLEPHRKEVIKVIGERIKYLKQGKICLIATTEKGEKISLSGMTRLLDASAPETATLF